MSFGLHRPSLQKDIFRDAGLDPNRPPRTIEELEGYCRQITRPNAGGRLTRVVGLRPIESGDSLPAKRGTPVLTVNGVAA
jgi:ABC-type glycerol-3-phosphate transport system substrate-binding protein